MARKKHRKNKYQRHSNNTDRAKQYGNNDLQSGLNGFRVHRELNPSSNEVAFDLGYHLRDKFLLGENRIVGTQHGHFLTIITGHVTKKILKSSGIQIENTDQIWNVILENADRSKIEFSLGSVGIFGKKGGVTSIGLVPDREGIGYLKEERDRIIVGLAERFGHEFYDLFPNSGKFTPHITVLQYQSTQIERAEEIQWEAYTHLGIDSQRSGLSNHRLTLSPISLIEVK
jgi:hypothetical protein